MANKHLQVSRAQRWASNMHQSFRVRAVSQQTLAGCYYIPNFHHIFMSYCWMHEHIICMHATAAGVCMWQAVRITRLQGYTPDVETVGALVWARNTTGAWWPGEALDPYHLPPTRTIPPLAAAGQTPISHTRQVGVRTWRLGGQWLQT